MAQRPHRLAAKQDRSVSLEKLQRVNTNIFIYSHNNRGISELLLSALSFETRKSLFIYFPFGAFYFFCLFLLGGDVRPRSGLLSHCLIFFLKADFPWTRVQSRST